MSQGILDKIPPDFKLEFGEFLRGCRIIDEFRCQHPDEFVDQSEKFLEEMDRKFLPPYLYDMFNHPWLCAGVSNHIDTCPSCQDLIKSLPPSDAEIGQAVLDRMEITIAQIFKTMFADIEPDERQFIAMSTSVITDRELVENLIPERMKDLVQLMLNLSFLKRHLREIERGEEAAE